MWLDILASRRWDRNPVDSNAKLLTLQPRGASSSEVNFKRLWIKITIVYIHPFNGYRDLNSYMKRLAINANGNTITSFAGELKPTGVGEYLSLLSSTLYIYIYIYTSSRHLTYQLSENRALKKHLIIKHNIITNQLTSSDVRKIFSDNRMIIYKNSNKKRLHIPQSICIKKKT